MGCANSSGFMSASMAKAEGAIPQRRESQRILNKKASLVQMCISTVCQAEERDTILSSEINSVEIDLSHFVFQGGSHSRNGRTLGLGGFGVVRRVIKLTGDDRGVEYAMKSMSKSAILKRSSGPASVMTELRALIMLLDCQFVCSIRYAFQDSKYLYIVLDLARGGDMRYNMRTTAYSRFSESAAKYYLCQIILAVSYCHKLSILHRDVKPENILMTEDGYIKLSDFGVAKILPNIEDCRSTSGTHGYMAPEMYVGEHIHGTAADWFATGITLHEFVTGRRPFEVHRLQAFRSMGSTTLAEYFNLPSNNSSNSSSGCEAEVNQNRDVHDPFTLDYLQSCEFISKQCKSFVRGLLCINPQLRLGSSRGFQELIEHPWLAGFDWMALIQHRQRAPCRPDVSYTRTDLTEEESRNAFSQLLQAPAILQTDQVHFKHYEYRNRVEGRGLPRPSSSHHQLPRHQPPSLRLQLAGLSPPSEGSSSSSCSRPARPQPPLPSPWSVADCNNPSYFNEVSSTATVVVAVEAALNREVQLQSPSGMLLQVEKKGRSRRRDSLMSSGSRSGHNHAAVDARVDCVGEVEGVDEHQQSRSLEDEFLTPEDGFIDSVEGSSNDNNSRRSSGAVSGVVVAKQLDGQQRECQDDIRRDGGTLIKRTTSNKKMRTESGYISTKMPSQLPNL